MLADAAVILIVTDAHNVGLAGELSEKVNRVERLAAILILAFHERANTRFAPTMARKSASDVGVRPVFRVHPYNSVK